MKTQKTFVIIDGNAIIHRAYHALPPLTAKDGTMVHAVYGFTSMLLKILHDLKPDYMAVSFDVAGGTFRDAVFSEYKAKRVKADQALYDQIPLVHQMVEAFGIPIYEKQGFEADDVIGTITNEKLIMNNEQLTAIIVSGDQDLLQLVKDDKVEVYLLKKGMSDFALYNEKAVREKFGFGPDRVVDYKSLRGDSSDNIPGVPGIGEKGATELIQKIGGISDIYTEIRNPKSEIRNLFKSGLVKKLIEGEASARMSKELATIRQDVPDLDFDLEKCKIGEFDHEKITDLFRKFEFYSLIKRLPGYEESASEQKKTSTKKSGSKISLTIADKSNLSSIIDELKKETVIACREITGGTDIFSSELLGLIFVSAEKSFYIEKPDKKVFELFADEQKLIVGHDVKQLYKLLSCSVAQLLQCKWFDIMIASYLINSSTRAHDFKSIVLRELGSEMPRGSDQITLFGVDPKLAVQELRMIYEVYQIYTQKLEDLEDLGLFEDVEMALVPVLAQMEMNGVSVDVSMLKDLSTDVAKEIKSLEQKIWKEAEQEFNVSSSVQLRDILFETMGLPTDGIKKGKTGYSTAASELEKLHGVHPIIEHIENYRELEKLRNTYIDVLPALINKKTGRIHTTYNQAVASTGRLSSSDPNIQNIPIRTEIGRKVREAFIAEDGNVLIAADYSQIELRIVASLAQDKKMMEIFERGEDIHTATAAVINNVSLDKVTKEMRSAAKGVNFGVLYGMGAFGLSSRTGITQWEAKDFIKKYFEGFKEVKKYLDSTLEFARKEGYVETLFGRRRYIPELLSGNYQLKNAGERMAINMPIQGTAADLMKMAMISVHTSILAMEQKSKWKSGDVKMILQVHDELVLEVKENIAQEVAELVKKEMEAVAKLRVPIVVEVGIGKRWGGIK